MARNYAALPYEYKREMKVLSDAEFGRLCRALIDYSESGTPIALSGNERFFADRVMMQEDRFREAYEKTAERNKENGSKGGRPKKPRETETNPSEPNETQKTETVSKPYLYLSPTIVGEDTPPLSPPGGSKRPRKAEPAVQWAENVTMTNEEHQKLLDAHGPADTARLIEILDNYKGSTGKRYKSDYRAILSWCVARLQEEKRKGGAKQTSNNPSARRSDPHNARKNAEWMRQVLAEEEKQGGGCDA